MSDNLAKSSNIYDRLFDFRKKNQIKLKNNADFYHNVNDVDFCLLKNNDLSLEQSTMPTGIAEEEIISSSSSNYSSYSHKQTISEFLPFNFNSVRSKNNKKTQLNRSKSLVLNNQKNYYLQENYIDCENESNPVDIYNKLNENLNKPKIHPRSIYLTYEKPSKIYDISNYSNEGLQANYRSENYQDMPEMTNGNLNNSSCSARSVGKHQFKSFLSRKLLNKSVNSEANSLDDSRLSAFRNKLMSDFINPIKKSISSASSKSSSFSSSLSCSSSSSNPPSPLNLSRKFKEPNSGSNENYESIYDDEIEKKTLSKSKVVDELIQTEMDFYKVMKLLYDVYIGPNSDNSISNDLKDSIFCNIKDIVDLSSVLLNDFESNILNRNHEQIRIGKCFLKNCEIIRTTYSHYAQYIEYSNSLLEKNEKAPELQRFIDNGLLIIKLQVNTLDLQSLLLKPIQRVLKYPLLLQELIKNTESFNEDYQDLLEALKSMQNVATYINEIKRRHELIVKYGRKIKENSTITNKMSKLTMHSMIKKSNRISVKLSNVLKINTVATVDEKFDYFETKFRSIEKLIKSFIKDAVQLLSSLKEFLKTQMSNSESLQEYFGDDRFDEIVHLVQINSHFLSDFIAKRSILIHEKVIKPLKHLLEFLEIPNKLIIKRNDKLLDYEFAKLNIEKSKDKYSYKTNQDNLMESQKNFEALNNQLIEELPQLIQKCTIIFEKCFQIFTKTQKNIYQTIHFEIQNLINKHKDGNVFLNENQNSSYTSIAPQLNNILQNFLNNNNNHQNISFSNNSNSKTSEYSEIGKNPSFSNSSGLDIMHRFFSTKPEPTKRIKSIFNLQIFKNLSNQENSKNSQTNKPNRQVKQTNGYNNSYEILQTDEIRDRLKRVYQNNLFIVHEKYSGFGLSDNLNLEVNDLVYVLKKSDPCGNPDSWFVDNGISKGIVPARILEPYTRKLSKSLLDLNQNYDYNHDELDDTFTDTGPRELVNDKNSTFNYENNSNEDIGSLTSSDDPKIEYCVAMYPFESQNESTLAMFEGERFKIVEKHDSTMNTEWWLVERIDEYEHGKQGYVPANYVELVKY